LEIRVNDNDIEKAIKILKRKLEKDGLMGELKKRRFYEKPSAKMKTKQREARKRKAKNRSRRIQTRRPPMSTTK
jgi:small subunit ribosomal protein S21